MNLIERNYDVLTGVSDLEPLHSFKKFPVFMGCVDEKPNGDLFAEMSWQISRSSGLIQLNPVLPLNIIYQVSHGSGSTGLLWDQHHSAFARFVHGFSPKSVLEIGGCHGILAKKYHSLAPIEWTIVEPNPMPVDDLPAKIIKSFFDDKFACNQAFDTLIHSHVFEHVYEPDMFMRHLAGFVGEGKTLIFSIPNMEIMLERKYTNCINFEHTVFLTDPYVEYLLSKYGFRLIKKEYFLDDHSIFYAAVCDTSVLRQDIPGGLYEKNRRLYLEYVEYHNKLIEQLNGAIQTTERPVYLFGAHVFSQYLIAFGLNADNIVCLLDNDSKKQGKRLYGTSLNVFSPTVLSTVVNPLVILKAGVYNNEVRQDILENINPNTEFLE
ncbi:MAG: methyltransferase [Geobacter sp.]|nr:MAG: methyltransferase [Geobacter sp.]